MNFYGVGGQCREIAWNLIAKTKQAEHILTQVKHIQVSDVCVPVSSMGDLKQKPLKGSCLEPSLSYANVWFPHLSPGHWFIHKNNPNIHLVLKNNKMNLKFPLTKAMFFCNSHPRKWRGDMIKEDNGCTIFPCAYWCWSILDGFRSLLAISPFCALWWDVVEHDRHLVLCLGEMQRGEKWGILNTMQRFTAVTIVSIILDMTLMQAQGCL